MSARTLIPAPPGRLLGDFAGTVPQGGPTVVVTGGLHGNEPSGVEAVQKVLRALEVGQEKSGFRGRLIGVAGNLRALAQDRRFVRYDLNRRWFPRHLHTVRHADPKTLEGEDLEQRELLEVFEPLLSNAVRPVVFLDLHSTSGPGSPFACMSDVLRNREIAFALKIPVVLGLEEVIVGSMLGRLCDLGHVGVAVEGGQHHDSKTRRVHEAAIWVTLVAAGCLTPADIEHYEGYVRCLEEASAGLPRVVEIRHRHATELGDAFEMEEGFSNFMPVEKGRVVARDAQGPVTVPQSGLMMLPRYQGEGDDGYFIAREIKPMWLGLSAWLRRHHLDRVVPMLPGVTVDPERADYFQVDPKIARLYAAEVFHLFGYRRNEPRDGKLVFSRRRPQIGAVTARRRPR